MPPPRPAGCRTLAEYISELINRLGEGEPALLRRLRDVVGDRRARITLDDETVVVRFEAGRLVVLADAPEVPVAGDGACDRTTTLRLLDGYREVTEAVLEGDLRASGDIESLTRIFQAIEILLDGAARNPELQALARDYRADPCRPPPQPALPGAGSARVVIDPDCLPRYERALLERLDLLPEPT
ncbi:MAG: hypothetical protein ACREMX_15200 [Gemmatimonadales bacterium]